jgi:hypothetical protein
MLAPAFAYVVAITMMIACGLAAIVLITTVNNLDR